MKGSEPASIDRTSPSAMVICANAKGAETIIEAVAITKTSMTAKPIGKIDFLMPKADQDLDRRLYKKYGFCSLFFLKSQSNLAKLELL